MRQKASPRPDWRKGAGHAKTWGKNVLGEGTASTKPRPELGMPEEQRGQCGRNIAGKTDEWSKMRSEKRRETDHAWA